MRWSIALITLGLLASTAHADRVHLTSGSVIEGKVVARSGHSDKDDKVVVEVESGEISLPSDSVARIEAGESDVQRFEARYAKLKPGDVKGLIALADFCRDHGMREHERELLLKVIEHAPEHAEARARLGYVRSDAGWITRDEQMRAQGLVQYEGRWLTREQLLALEQLKAQTETAQHNRDKAELELKRQQLELEQAQAKQAQAERERADAQSSEQPANDESDGPVFVESYPRYVGWAPIVPDAGCGTGFGTRHRHCRRPAPRAKYHPSPFIVGAKDPFDYLRDGR